MALETTSDRRANHAKANTENAGRDGLNEQVYLTVRKLTLELHPEWRHKLIVGADSDLDRDLGFDSLARAELLLRLNREFGIALADQLIVEANTAGDICDAVAAAAPKAAAAPATRARPATLPGATAPSKADTLVQALAAHVSERSERLHVELVETGQTGEQVTYGALDRAARALAQGLLDRGIEPGERVAIMLPTGRAFFETFFGALLAGAVPVPIYPPFRRAQIAEHLRRQAGVLRNAEAALLVTDDATGRFGALLSGLVTSLRGVSTAVDLTAKGTPIAAAFPATPSDTALIQYTSGSTGDPKGVVLSHANLLANIRAMGAVMQAESSDVFVSWLPLYHDMGLIGAWLGSLYYAVPAMIMSPLSFIADPSRWLWAIHNHRATLSAAPNFAFELCLKRVTDDDIKGLDLGSLRMVVNGAEPVSPSTIVRFTERFQPYGFAPQAMAPVYGLAENSVGLAFPPPGRAPIIDRVNRGPLSEQGVARPARSDDRNVAEFVACGQPLPGHQIRIVDDTGRELPERRQGRLEFKGPSATAGYFRSPEKNRTLFRGDWLDSGDLAYIADGDIHLTGRIKDVIIRAGRNIYPHELEECVGNVEGVRKGCVAVIAATDVETGTEKLVVVAETRVTDNAMREDLKKRILSAAGSILELPPEEIVLVAPHAVPKTSSGKIRRATTRELYETDRLGLQDRALWPQLVRLALEGAAGQVGRVRSTLAAYFYAAWWWTVLLAIAAVIWPLVVLLPRRAWRHSALRLGARALFAATGIPFRVDCELPAPKEDVIFVVNHGSYIDGAAISAAISGPLTFIVTERLRRQFVAGTFLRRLGTVFVQTEDAGLHGAEEAALKAVRAGERLVVFPEGRLRRMPGLLSFYPGSFLVAAKASVPIVPVALTGPRSVLRHSGQWFPRRAPITVHIGRPLHAEGEDFDAILRLEQSARRAILAKNREPDLGREAIEFGISHG